MIELTEEQRRELDVATVPCAIDPQTRKIYILVAEDLYERLQALLVPDRTSLAEQRALLHSAGLRAGWDDQAMDIYDREEEGQGMR